MGNIEDTTGLLEQAERVGEWVRREVYNQGLEDTPEVFDYLVKDWMIKNGISEHTTKLSLLGRLNDFLSQKPKTTDNRSKIKEITTRLQSEFAERKARSDAIHRGQKTALRNELLEAMKTIKKQDRALKSFATKNSK